MLRFSLNVGRKYYFFLLFSEDSKQYISGSILAAVYFDKLTFLDSDNFFKQ